MGAPLDTKDPVRFDYATQKGRRDMYRPDGRKEKWWESVMRFPTKVNPTVFGRNLGDPLNLTGFEKGIEPPKPAPPPPPPDETAVMMRELSRTATNNELRRSQGRNAAFSGTYRAGGR